MPSPRPSGRLVNPVPGGTVGRTDQGVDISGPPGTPIYAITNETLVGIIQNWYNGQPFYWFKEQGSNVYNYVAEQVTSRLRIGQSVTAGQEIGQIASSGTGLELGWATASGQTLARATTGYTEGEATPAGQSYRREVIQGGGSASGGGGSQTDTLAQLWIQAGGKPGLANLMAAIAMAESGGKVSAQNPSGAAGLWQILPSAHPQYNVQRLLSDPLYNAQAAVATEKSQGLGAWSTYTSGAYKQFLNMKGGPTYTLNRPGGDASGGSGSGSGDSGPSTLLSNYSKLRDMPRTAPPGTANPFQWFFASFTGNWDALSGATPPSNGSGGTDPGIGGGSVSNIPQPTVPTTTGGLGHQGLGESNPAVTRGIGVATALRNWLAGLFGTGTGSSGGLGHQGLQ